MTATTARVTVTIAKVEVDQQWRGKGGRCAGGLLYNRGKSTCKLLADSGVKKVCGPEL